MTAPLSAPAPAESLLRFDVITIFPGFFSGALDWGVLRRARETRLVETVVHDLRQWAHDRHRTVDDRPFGGGEGMVLKPDPLFEAVESMTGRPSIAEGPQTAVILLSASGKLFSQPVAARLAGLRRIILLCGRYEGVDERVAEHLADEELSIGDFILSGGELGAAIVMDAVTRLLPGALGNADSARNESFCSAGGASPVAPQNLPPWLARLAVGASRESTGILDCPHYTRPQVFRGWEAPAVLISGDHEQVRRWRRKSALARTLRNRPGLLLCAPLCSEDLALLDEIRAESSLPAGG